MPWGDSELRTRDVHLAGAGKGYRCFGRVVSTGQIELVASASREALDADAQAQTLIPIPINLDA